jgi:hypothetical protein
VEIASACLFNSNADDKRRSSAPFSEEVELHFLLMMDVLISPDLDSSRR